MYESAKEVLGWLDADQLVGVARVVAVRGLSGIGLGNTAAIGPGGARLGGVLGGAADGQVRGLLAQALARPGTTWMTEIAVSDEQARSVGLLCGGSATVLVQPGTQIPRPAWAVLAEREPICLVTDLSGPELGRTTWFTLESLATGHDAAVGGGPARHVPGVVGFFGHGAAGTAITLLPEGTEVLVAALWPPPRLLVVGAGALADALSELAAMLSWQVQVVAGAEQGVRRVGWLGRGDAVVVGVHEVDQALPVLLAALSRGVGYVGAVGPRRHHADHAQALAAHGVPAEVIGRIRAPAGLALGGRSPQEVALSVAAEVLGVHNHTSCAALRDEDGPVHHQDLSGPPELAY